LPFGGFAWRHGSSVALREASKPRIDLVCNTAPLSAR
jgi:hypothetical protein